MNKRKAAIIKRKSLINIKDKKDIIVVRSIREISESEYNNEIKRIEESLAKIRKMQYSPKQTPLNFDYRKKNIFSKSIQPFEINEFVKKGK